MSCRKTIIVSMNISQPDPARDGVHWRTKSGYHVSVKGAALILDDQDGMADEECWLRDLDASIVVSMSELHKGDGVDLDVACNAVVAELDTSALRLR